MAYTVVNLDDVLHVDFGTVVTRITLLSNLKGSEFSNIFRSLRFKANSLNKTFHGIRLKLTIKDSHPAFSLC